MFKRLIAAAALAFAGLAAAAPANAMTLEQAVNRVVHERREARDVDINGHGFHIKPLTYTVRDHRGLIQSRTIEGQISHKLRFRADDQFYFRLTVDATGRITSYEEWVNQGGVLATIFNRHVVAVLTLGGRIETSQNMIEAVRRIAEYFGPEPDNSWRSAARLATLRLAAEVAAQMPRPSLAPTVVRPSTAFVIRRN